MDIEKKVKILRACSSKNGERCSSCPAFGRGDRNCMRNAMKDAATFLSTLQAELARMRESLDFARTKDDEIVRLGLELEVRKRQEEAMTDIANDFQRQLHTALDELEQVKHQRDSYRLYHDDLASKPNCNTCADKDCKYRPIPGDTVRANCPLWRGPEEG